MYVYYVQNGTWRLEWKIEKEKKNNTERKREKERKKNETCP